MAKYSPRPKTADVLTLCASACMMGAQAIFPVIGHVFGLFLFYGGLAVATFYLLWRWGLHYIGRAVTRSGREPVWKAVKHVAAVLHDTESNESYPAARTAIRQAALDGHLHVYGHKSDQPMGKGGNYNTVSTLIPRAYWEKADLSPISTSEEFANRFDCHTFPHKMSHGKFGAEIELYARCAVNWREVLKQWR